MKTVALVVMLLASSSFGAALLAPAQVDGSTGTAVVTLAIDNDIAAQTGGEGLFGYSLAASTNKPVVITGRANLLSADGITDPTNTDTSVLNKQLSACPDLGYTGVAGTSAVTRSGNIVTYTLTLAPSDMPITINWSGTLVSTFFSEFPVVGTTMITPEPISMLLLGLGGLFFARRRRA